MLGKVTKKKLITSGSLKNNFRYIEFTWTNYAFSQIIIKLNYEEKKCLSQLIHVEPTLKF